ncbi:MAG: RpiB/LacA/LacB family sugar-phosphate isomerase [Alphaproteobacteria bacterium]|nr:RpiB/LacA/LacB family sugar-phosphate isomerase [Alphaproteobacteria bacterium]
MIIGIFSDHGGYALKQQLIEAPLNYKMIDYGCHSTDAVNYPDYAQQAAECLADKVIDRAVLICGTGIGMCIAANRHAYVRAFVAHTPIEAQLARAHNDANVICFSGRYQTLDDILPLLDLFIDIPFESGRHAMRIAQFSKHIHDQT